MDLTPLVQNDSLDIAEYVCGFIDEFKGEVRKQLGQRLGRAI
jgi:hypothetical protein